MKGTIIKSTGLWYSVRSESNTIVQCRIQGKFRLKGLKLTNPVAVGDRVEYVLEKRQNTGVIKKILPRVNYMVRQSPKKRTHLHLIAANIDQVLLFVTIKQPNLKLGFIDRFLVMTAPFNIPTYIVFNKADLLSEEDLEIYEALKYIYEDIGYHVELVSALQQKNLKRIQDILKGKTSLLSGHSGVGKTTLINALQPQLKLRTKEISDYSGKGQHTTTFAEMHTLNFGGQIIDTPGIKSLTFIDLIPMDVAHNFLEFFEASANCKYSNCMHVNEPHCAVKAGVEAGTISELRYHNYLQILEEVRNQKHWERHRNM